MSLVCCIWSLFHPSKILPHDKWSKCIERLFYSYLSTKLSTILRIAATINSFEVQFRCLVQTQTCFVLFLRIFIVRMKRCFNSWSMTFRNKPSWAQISHKAALKYSLFCLFNDSYKPKKYRIVFLLFSVYAYKCIWMLSGDILYIIFFYCT